MAGTRTAPDVTGATTEIVTGLSLVDASGDLYSDSIITMGATAPSAALVQAWSEEYQALSNASLYEVRQTRIWSSDYALSNAVAAYRGSVKDGINVAYKNYASGKAQTPRLVAPTAACFNGNLDVVVLDDMVDFLVAQVAMLSGYTFQHAQFTERRERRNNPKTL